MGEGDLRTRPLDPLGHDVGDLEEDLPALGQPGRDQVLDHLLLAVHGDRPPRHQLLERDPVALPAEPQLDAVMDQALAQHPLPRAGADEGVHGALLQDAGPHPMLNVIAAAGLQDHRLDAAQVQEVGEQQAGRPGADDRDLRTHLPLLPPVPAPPPIERIGPPRSERECASRSERRKAGLSG